MKTKYILLICLLSLLPFLSIFTTSLNPHTQDSLVHLARMGAYFKALQDGQFPVRWAGDLNYGYGMPLFNFIYQVPYVVSSLFLLLGLGLVLSFKLTLTLSFVLSGIFAFIFAYELFEDEKKALWFTIFYQFAPFRLVELLVRGDVGEVYVYTFLPLVCFGLTKLAKKVTVGTFLLTSVVTALLILTHNSLSLSFFAVCIVLTLFIAKNRGAIVSSFLALGMGLFLSAYYWLPALADHKYTYGDLFMKDIYLSHFAPFQNFFTPNLFNTVSLQMGGVAIQFGIFHELAILLALLVLFNKKADPLIRKLSWFGLILVACTVFLMQPVSKALWERVPLLRQFQFPWRLLGVVVFATSLLSVSFSYAKLWNQKVLFSLILFGVVATTVWYWHPAFGYDKVQEGYYWNFPLTSTYYGETDVIWSEGPAKAYPKQRVEFAAGNGSITHFSKTSTKQSFLVEAKTPATVVDHTEYFPGWKAFVNGHEVPIQFQDQNYRGQITFAVPAGVNHVQVVFGETKIRFFADMLSLVTLIGLVLFGMWRKIAYAKRA